jgi:hypothetical protein
VLCVRALRDCKIFSWVQRSTLQLRAQGGERKREEEREICKLRVQKELYALYQETQLCGCSPRERVNHVYLFVLCG